MTFAHELLIESGLSKSMLEQAVAPATAARQIRLRKRVPEFFRMLEGFGVPLLIFSAGIADVLAFYDHQPGCGLHVVQQVHL